MKMLDEVARFFDRAHMNRGDAHDGLFSPGAIAQARRRGAKQRLKAQRMRK